MIDMIRTALTSVAEGVIKRFSGLGRPGETFNDREYIQHYGFTSRPLSGAEGIVLKKGNVVIQIASDDRRYRISLENGEAAMYDDQGQVVRMERDKTIHVYGTDHLVADAAVDAVITAPLVKAVASSKVELTTPLVDCSGNVNVGGNLTVTGTGVVTGALSSATSVSDPGGTMQSMRGVFDSHTHNENGDGGGVTDPPNQQM